MMTVTRKREGGGSSQTLKKMAEPNLGKKTPFGQVSVIDATRKSQKRV